MEVNELFTKLKEYGHVNTKRAELRELCKLNGDQLLKNLPRRILNSDGCKIVDCLLNGLSDNTTAFRSKIKVIDMVIKTLRKESTSLTHCGDLVSRIGLELAKLPASELVQWSNDAVQSIVDDSDVNMIWKDILPECLNVLSTTDTVKHCGTDMSSAEYKGQCVRTLCQCGWKERQLVQLTAMFNDMQLSRSDHKQVVNKICTYVMECPPDTLPALVHQLIKLCKTHDFDIVLSHLGHYFSAQLYTKLAPPTPDSEATTMDVDDIVSHSPAEVSRALSTCIYHIIEGMEKQQLCKLLSGWPRSLLLRSPFLLDLALALCEERDCRALCLQVMKAGIVSRECDLALRASCAGARSVLPRAASAAAVLRVLTNESASHRQLTTHGLISLAFALLSVPAGRPCAASCWSLGSLVLARLSKAQPETAPHMLARLADCLHTNPMRQYADCLYVLCKLTPLSVERCSQLSAILENCSLSSDLARAMPVLDAVHPLVNFSVRTRDCLFMVCRKGIYSRDPAHRCLALAGFLTILRHVKVSTTFSSSQSACSEDSHLSYLTQLTVVHATQQGAPATSVRNESVCLEVVSVLRRCLVQDAAVKQMLYSKLYDCVRDKPALHEYILEFLNEHLSKYLEEDQVLWDKCVQITGATAVLVEPISNLLYVTAQFLQEGEEDLEDILASQAQDGSAVLRSKLALDLGRICGSERFGTIDMGEPGLSDLTPESKAKSLKVQQILASYEALIAYQIMKWDRNSSGTATVVLNLFKGYSQLLDNTKATPKLGKKGSKSTLNESRDSAKSQKSQKSQKDKEKGPVKVSNLTKDRAGPFKTLPCVWDLRLCLRVIELLYSEEVAWCSVEQRNRVRASRELHHWALRCVRSVAERADRQTARLLTSVAAILYKRCVCRFRDMCDFDDTTALGCVELFKDCLAFILAPDNGLKTANLLSTITNITDEQESTYLAAILEQVHLSLTHVDEDSTEEDRDIVIKKLVTVLCQLAAVLLETPVAACERYTAVLLKLEDYVRSSKQDCLSLIPPLLTAGARIQQEAPLLDELLDKLASALGRIDEEDTSAGGEDSPRFPSVDCRTGHTVLTHICVHLNTRGGGVEHLLQRAKDLDTALPLAARSTLQAVEREQQEVYSAVILQLCQLTAWTRKTASLRCSVGGGSSRVLQALARLYTWLSALVKQLSPATLSAHTRSVERLLKLCGKKLSSVVDNLVMYIEASQSAAPRRVLRDTKLIPRVVFEAESFGRQAALLSHKAKVDLMQYLPLGTARDFRIRAPVIEEMLRDHTADDAEDEEPTEVPEALSPAASDVEDTTENDENVAPPSKKRRS